MTTSPENWDQYKEAVLGRLDLAKVFASVQGQRPSGDGCVTGLCPFHDDSKASFGINLKTGAWECFAGCGKGDVFNFLMKQSGRPFKEVISELGDSLGIDRPKRPARTGILATYPYHDEEGKLLFEVVRKPGKKFPQRRPDGKGGWDWSLKGVRRVLYRLPELIARPDEVVYLPEGEKDCDRLASLGLLATTNPGGAKKWKPAYTEFLVGRDVVVLADNDEPGREHAGRAAKSLRGKAKSVRVVRFPDLWPKGDVSDWLDAGGDRPQLEAIVEQTPEYVPGSLDPPVADGADLDRASLPKIMMSNRPLRVILDESWAAVLTANDPPRVFNSYGYLARLRDFGQGPQIELIDERVAVGLLADVADWFVAAGKVFVHAAPPKAAAANLIVNPHPDLPKLDSVITTPVFDRDWRLVTEPGYHAQSRLWMHQTCGADMPPVSEQPTDAEARAALSWFVDELLHDFRFTSRSGLAHTLAALLLPFARRMFNGPTPIHMIEAPSIGSGKSLLADLISMVALGFFLGCTTMPGTEDEVRKKLTAILSRGPAIVAIDNLAGGLWSAQVAAAITAETWEDRLLGKTQMVTYPNRALWLVTSNNPRLSGEIARRCVRIRIDPGEAEPWRRTGFKHDPIREWAMRHRPQLVHALLTLIQHWIRAGAPMLTGAAPLGSFESWSRVIGGIVQHHGVEGFLTDSGDLFELANTDDGQWHAFIVAWWEEFRSTPVNGALLLNLAARNQLVPFAMGSGNERSQQIKFGRALGGLRDRRFGDFQVVLRLDSHTRTNLYALQPTSKELFA